MGREEEEAEVILKAGGELGREEGEGRAEVLLLTLELREKEFMDGKRMPKTGEKAVRVVRR